MNYRVKITKRAKKRLDGLGEDARRRINTALKRLIDYYNGVNVPLSDVKTLKGKYQNLLRLRIGDLRVIFKIENDEFVILVIDVVSRGNAYNK